jgi:TonB family protein
MAAGSTMSMAQPTRPAPIDINECRPPYPPEARRANEEGKTRLRLHVAASGALRGVSLVGSSGSPRLDQAIIEAVGRCRFAPARSDGEAVDGSFVLEFAWRLEAPAASVRCAPDYPAASVAAGEQGTTTLRLRIEEGKVKDVRVAVSSGHVRLDAAAVAAVAQCTFRMPAQAPVSVDTLVRYVWKIEDGIPLVPVSPLGPVAPDPYRPPL